MTKELVSALQSSVGMFGIERLILTPLKWIQKRQQRLQQQQNNDNDNGIRNDNRNNNNKDNDNKDNLI